MSKLMSGTILWGIFWIGLFSYWSVDVYSDAMVDAAKAKQVKIEMVKCEAKK